MRVLQDFGPRLNGRLHAVVMPHGELFRRSIGRNRVALGCTEDIVWYTDVDHVFGPQCLNELWDIFRSLNLRDPDAPPTLVWPESLLIHRDHLIGDVFWQQNTSNRGLIEINPTDFEYKSYHSAIGGVQIVKGEHARKYGYLSDRKKWQQPRTDGKPFGDFRDDVSFRRACLERGPGFSIPIPNLYRLRHTRVTYKG